MTFKHDGYHRDGTMCVYGYDSNGVKVVIFKGFPNLRSDTVTLYPKVCLVPTRENIGKQQIPMRMLK